MWLTSILDSLKSNSPRAETARLRRRARRANPSRARLTLETLEERSLLTFMAPVTYAVGTAPLAVATADFNNDGKLDQVVANSDNASLSVLLGNGNGTFQPAINIALGFDPRSVAVGDFNNDGKEDIVAAGDSHVAELLGNGDGTFQPPLALSLPGQFPSGYAGPTALSQDPLSVAVGDLNSDGKLDLVVTAKTTFHVVGTYYYTNYYAQNGYVNVLLGNGDGSFSAAQTTPLATTNPGSVAVADLDGDNKPDVVIADSDAASVSVFLGNGDGSLQPPTSFSTGSGGNPVSVTVGDINGDGKLDLVTANDYYGSGIVSVLLGNGNGTFQPALNVAAGSNAQSVAISDFNKDGKADLAVANSSGISLLLGNGDGTFQSALGYAAGTGPSAVAVGDFNGDGFPDLAVADQGVYDPSLPYDNSGSGLSVLINGADWSTIGAPTNLVFSGFPSTITAGVPGDITVTVRDNSGNTAAGYQGTLHFSSGDGQAVLPADYTFTAADGGMHTFSATLKTAGGQELTATDTTTASLAVSDTDIYVTAAAASHLDISAPTGSKAGSAFTVTVMARDPYNNIASGYTGTVHFTSSDAQAILPADYTFTTGYYYADYGVHIFNGVTLQTPGSQTVTASDTLTSSIAGSAAVTVSPVASTMTVAGFPSPTTAGVAGSFTVTLLDSSGNVVTDYTGTVHFTSSDPQAVLPANYTFTATDAGVHTFSATLKTAGAQSITVTDTVNANLHGTDSGITVKPAAASKFVISAPSSVNAGVPFSLTITVEDAYGNVVTGYVGTIYFKSTDKNALLPANYTFTAGDNGVHTFTGLVLNKKGKQTITVSDTKNSSITGKTVVDVL